MSENFEIKDLSSLHSYRTEIPNIVGDLDISPYDFRLYFAYKQIAGDGGGCWCSNANLAKKAKMSPRQVQISKMNLSKNFNELDGLPLIRITKRKKPDGGDDSDLITMIDIWPINMQKKMKRGGGAQYA